jgi:hypothetical protein
VQDRIKGLSDDMAVRLLTTITQTQLRIKNYQAELTPEIRQALQGVVSSPHSDESFSGGELARQALLLLSEDPEIGPNLERLIENPPQKFDLGTTMVITVAALIAVQTHVRFERDKAGKWKLVIEKKPTNEGLLKILVRGILGWKG